MSDHEGRSRIDASEGAQNANHTKASQLLKILMEKFGPEEFSIEDVAELNPAKFFRAMGHSRLNRFGQSHIDILVEKGLVQEVSGDPGLFQVADRAMAIQNLSAWQREITDMAM